MVEILAPYEDYFPAIAQVSSVADFYSQEMFDFVASHGPERFERRLAELDPKTRSKLQLELLTPPSRPWVNDVLIVTNGRVLHTRYRDQISFRCPNPNIEIIIGGSNEFLKINDPSGSCLVIKPDPGSLADTELRTNRLDFDRLAATDWSGNVAVVATFSPDGLVDYQLANVCHKRLLKAVSKAEPSIISSCGIAIPAKPRLLVN